MRLNIPKVLGAVAFTSAILLGCGAVANELPYPKSVQVTLELPVYEEEYVEMEYVISDKDDQYYYGNGDYTDYPGIVFTQEFIPSGAVLNVGDVVYAVFEADNLDDGLLEVRLSGGRN